MSKKRWYMKWEPQAWAADTAVRSCSIAARGLWREMLDLMHAAEPYGHLVINGRAMTEKQLSGLANVDELTVNSLLTELQLAGIFSRTRGGVIYCRRMVRDYEVATEGRKNIEKRWEKQRASKSAATASPPDNPNRVPNRVPNSNPITLELELESELDKKEKPSLRSGSRATPKRVASRLPEGWEPRQQDLDGEQAKVAIAAGIDLVRETEKFRDYYRASGGRGATKLDWDAAYRFWLGNAPGLIRNRSIPPAQAVSNIGWNRY